MLGTWLWTPNHGSECQANFEGQTENWQISMLGTRLWTINWGNEVALNANIKMTLNAKTEKRWWLWTLSCKEVMKENMPLCSVLPQLLIHWKDLKETLWVSKDALLVSRNGQIDYKYSFTTHLTKSRSLMKYNNNLDASKLRYFVWGIHHHLKGMIHLQVSRKIVH